MLAVHTFNTLKLLFILLTAVFLSEQVRAEPVLNRSLLDDGRFQYHGYFYKNDVLKHENELREIRKFANTLVFSLIQSSDFTPEAIRHLATGNWDTLGKAVFDDMARRIQLVESLDYVSIGEAPFWPLVRFDRFEEYKNSLQYLEQRVPEFAKLDYVYFWDEPDINSTPNAKVLEKYIAEFKRVFPTVKVTTCYAIAKIEFLDTAVPPSYDLLMIDPYFLSNESRKHAAADFERFYRSRLALALEWANRQNKPYLMVGDAFGSISGKGKLFPTQEISLWYYLISLTQPKCSGLLWFQYGHLDTPEEITGVTLNGPRSELLETHREIGHAILGKSSPVGVPFKVVSPPLPLDSDLIEELSADSDSR